MLQIKNEGFPKVYVLCTLDQVKAQQIYNNDIDTCGTCFIHHRNSLNVHVRGKKDSIMAIQEKEYIMWSEWKRQGFLRSRARALGCRGFLVERFFVLHSSGFLVYISFHGNKWHFHLDFWIYVRNAKLKAGEGFLRKKIFCIFFDENKLVLECWTVFFKEISYILCGRFIVLYGTFTNRYLSGNKSDTFPARAA